MIKAAKEVNKKYEQIALEEAEQKAMKEGIKEIAKKTKRNTHTRRNSKNNRFKNRRNKITIVKYYLNLVLNEFACAKNPSYSAIGTEVFDNSSRPSFVNL